MDFSSNYPGQVDTENVSISNTGGSSLSLANLTITGPDAGRFALSGSCTALPVGGRCGNYQVTFTPVAGQLNYVATLTTNNGALGSQTDMLTATLSNARFLTASPAALTFAATPVGSTTATQNVTVTATGNYLAFLSTQTLSGNAAGNYVVNTGACPAYLMPGNSCTVTVAFKPLTAGNDNGTLTIANPSNQQNAMVTLTGSGTQALPIVSWNPATNLLFTGNAYGAGVLNATSVTPGSFSYTATDSMGNVTAITAATVPAAGSYTLTALFTPADLGTYASTTATIPFVVQNQNVFVVGQNRVAAFLNTGNVLGSSTAMHGGLGAAVDAGGNVWSIDATGSLVSKYTDAAVYTGSFSTGGTQAGLALAIDGLNRVLIVNGDGTVSILNNAGVAVSAPIAAAAGIATPASVSVDAAGSVWVADATGNKVVEIVGVAGPVAAPVVAAVATGKTGSEP